LADRGGRRFSQAISEGDGISLIVEVDGADAARLAEADGAEALVAVGEAAVIREASGLPILRTSGGLDEAAASGADAWAVDAGEIGVDDVLAHAARAGVEAVVAVRDDEELEQVLELHDPEIFLLTGGDLDHALELLSDVPVGKLAIVRVEGLTRDQVVELERRGMDAVIVAARNVAELVGGAPPTT
jgi:indole-3-glycerol phosphate synthase